MYTGLNMVNLNKLFCTFTTREQLNETIETINRKYSVLHDKIFILESPQTEEYICTYNIDPINITNSIIPNTILLHRKKDYNTLYTINALNTLIKSLNEGKLDFNYKIDWNNYKNCILLNQGDDLRKLDTSVYNIINLSPKI